MSDAAAFGVGAALLLSGNHFCCKAYPLTYAHNLGSGNFHPHPVAPERYYEQKIVCKDADLDRAADGALRTQLEAIYRRQVVVVGQI